ncbi:hypothetical protein ON010_g14512 [Phytophthora cinnamomi]|nr:hypothetical protein ON010_g14512 [Phytophthora cinnamomi]
MKFFAPLVVGVIAFFSSQVDANGVCYDPNHDSGMSASTVQADMKTIAGAGFDSVRTYISKFGDTEMGPIIAAAGLKAMLGVPYPQSDYQEQMEAAIKAANAGGVYAIMRHPADQVAGAQGRAGRHGAAQHGGDRLPLHLGLDRARGQLRPGRRERTPVFQPQHGGRQRHPSAQQPVADHGGLHRQQAHPDRDGLALQRHAHGQRGQPRRRREVLQRVPAVEQLHGREVLLPNVRHALPERGLREDFRPVHVELAAQVHHVPVALDLVEPAAADAVHGGPEYRCPH